MDVFGGLPASPARDAWNGNILLVERHHQLKATGNVLRVEARTSDGGSAGDVDDFILDNVVIMYKTLDVVPAADGHGRSRGVPYVRAPGLDRQRAWIGPERTPPISATNTSCPHRPNSPRGARCSGASSGAGITRTHKPG